MKFIGTKRQEIENQTTIGSNQENKNKLSFVLEYRHHKNATLSEYNYPLAI